MSETVVVLELSPAEYEKLVAVARARQEPVQKLAQSALLEWLEIQERLEQGRTLMREMGQGYADGTSPHDGARHHDAYLYPRKPS
jgi:hypothetical protein